MKDIYEDPAKALSEFYAGRGMKSRCELCGLGPFMVQKNPPEELWAQMAVAKEGSIFVSPAFMPLLIMTCQHCGTIRQVSASFVQEWHDKNDAAPAVEGEQKNAE